MWKVITTIWVALAIALFVGACGRRPEPTLWPTPTPPTYTAEELIATAEAMLLATPATATPVPAWKAVFPDWEQTAEVASMLAELDPDPTELHSDYLDYLADEDRERELIRSGEITSPTCTWVRVNANLYAGPGAEYGIVGHVPQGACVHVDGRNEEITWLEIDAITDGPEEFSAWIAADLLENINPYISLWQVKMVATPQPQSPVTPRPLAQNCSGGCTVYPTWCEPPIKGNVGFDSDERIYHVPGGEFYEQTTIRPDYGERWFCTEAEAQAAGWRRSQQ